MFTKLFYHDNVKTLSAMQKKAGISFPTQLPIYHSPPDENKLQAWIENHNSFPEVKNIAAKLASHINYIPFDTLLTQLQCMITQFNSFNLPYILWIPQRTYIVSEGCSDLWIAGLCFEHCRLNQPVAIAFTNQLSEVLKQHPTVHNILMLDDASYSANHIKNEIQNLRRFGNTLEKYNLYIGIPFMTKHAVEVIVHESKDAFETNAIILLNYKNLPMMTDILDAGEQDYLIKEFGYFFGARTLSYFDHRYPDEFSTLWCFQDGSHLLSVNITKAMEHLGSKIDTDQWDDKVKKLFPISKPVVPVIIPPYRLKNALKFEELKIAINAKKLGHRTIYPIQATENRVMRAKGINIEDTTVADFLEYSPKRAITGIEPFLSFFKPKQTLILLGALTLFLIPENFFADKQSISNLQHAFILVIAFFVTTILDNIKSASQMNFSAKTQNR